MLDRCEEEARRQLSVLMELLQKEQKLATNTERKADTHDASSSPQQISAAAPQQRSAPAAAPKQTSAAASAPPQQTWSVNILSSFLQQRHGQEEVQEKEEVINEDEDVKKNVKEKDKDSIWRDDGKLQCPECRMRLVSHGRVLRDHIGEEYKYKDSQ